MNVTRFITKLLKLKDLKVTWFSFENRNSELHLGVKPYKNGCLCPECDNAKRCKILRVRTEIRTWRDITVCGIKIVFFYNPRDIWCPVHGQIQEEISWAAPNARITYRLEYLILVYCQIATQKATTRLLGMPKSTVSNQLHRIITRIREGHKIRGLRSIGIDEISYRKGKKYATIVYDLDRSCVIWVGRGKGRATIDQFFNELSDYQKKQIKTACCDMSRAYLEAVKTHCPDAMLVIDRFHIVKALNEAVDGVRKEEWRQLGGDQRKAIKGLRWLLFRHSNNRTKNDTQMLNALRKSNKRIYRAWVLKDEFEAFWEYIYPGVARKFINGWITRALKSRLEPLRKFANTLKGHFENIITFIECGLTNAIGEGINRIIKMVKNRASGFYSLKSFTDIIFLTVGDLDIPGQIPKKFRTI